MALRIFWNRRSGVDRRRPNAQQPEDDRRLLERRHPRSDSYVLVVGNGGLDRNALMVITLVVCLFLAGSVGTYFNFL